jgi:hypothetical protein
MTSRDVGSADEPGSMEPVAEPTDAPHAPDVDVPTTATPADVTPAPTVAAAYAPERLAGDVVIRADLAGTLLFGVTAAIAAIVFTSVWQWVAAITALVLFAVGVFAFLWSYWNAVQRSRTDEISVTGLYFLLGPAIPSRVRRTMLLTLVLQVVIALVTALARSEGTDGRPGTSLALGFLVPMFGFGLNGLWAAYHGDFPPRDGGYEEPGRA